MRRAHIIVSGKVQGVLFRSETRFMGQDLGLVGWVGNKPDGSVEIVAEGTEDKLKDLIRWCWRGPRDAVVEHVEISWDKASREFSSFKRKN